MMEALRRNWRDLLGAWSVAPALSDREFEKIREHYGGPDRFYHTLDHIGNVLETIAGLGSLASDLNAVKMAAWLHDVIYDSKNPDNEERSAAYAERLCEKLSIPHGGLVAALIRKTKTHEADENADAQVLLDADLAILGAGESDYRDYTQKIRCEYGWVSESDYRQGRARVLQSFLNRPRIFHFMGHLEAPARRNLAAEIAKLTLVVEA